MSLIWITGLAGSGKTTLARAVGARIAAPETCIPSADRHTGAVYFTPALVHLDGDAIRRGLGEAGAGYAREQRLAVARRITALAATHSRAGRIAVVSTISLFHEIHALNRYTVPDYFEVCLECAGGLRETRLDDGRPLAGPQVGAEIAAELPLAPHLRLDTGSAVAGLLADAVVAAWRRRHV
jgi:adenylylsulfate kinase-like enzyme